MNIVPHGGRQITIHDLIRIGRELGISANDIREIVHNVGGNIVDAAHHLGADFYDEFNQWVQEVGRRPGRNALERLSGRSDPLLDYVSGRDMHGNSLSNSHGQEQEMTKRHHGGDPIAASHGHEAHNMGNAPEEGGEQQVTVPQHIWRRFPNTQTAALKWVETIFASENADLGSAKVPFDRQDVTTATALNVGGGGAWTGTAKNTLAGNTSLFASAINLDVPQLFQLRMTSPYNILKTQYSNTAGGYGVPTWLGYFDSMYQYYHVMETEWELTMHFGTPITATDTPALNWQHLGIWVLWKYTNQDDPPVSWTNKPAAGAVIAFQGAFTNNVPPTPDQASATLVTDSGTTSYLTVDDYDRMGGWNKKYVSFDTIVRLATYMGVLSNVYVDTSQDKNQRRVQVWAMQNGYQNYLAK